MQSSLEGNSNVLWLPSHDRNPRAQALADRHYSRKHRGAKEGFVGPGEKLVLMSPEGDALFAWLYSKPEYRADGLDGINCTIFRNEGTVLSSRLILEAEKWALMKWPKATRFYTYIAKTKVNSKRPGWCFLKAGWREVGVNKSGTLLLLVKEVKA